MLHNVYFVDRNAELAFLEDAYSTDKSQMIIVYGRQRVGKTCLLQKFIKNKKHNCLSDFKSSKRRKNPENDRTFSWPLI